MPYKDKQKQREYSRNWMRRKRLGLPTKLRKKLTEKEKRNRKLKYRRMYERRIRKKRDKIFKLQCWICNSTIRLCLHKKDGEPHRSSTTSILEAIKNPDQWIRLCGKCHDGVHFCMKHLGMSWEDIIELLQQKSN